MSWVLFAFIATIAVSLADIFRKLGSSLKDPLFSNLIFQTGAFITAIVIYFVFSRQPELNPRGILYAFIGGICLSIFTTFFFKALAIGPGVSTVSPVIRIGSVMLVALLGIFLLREKLTWNLIVGILFASTGVYLLFLNK
jgi:uncharacterized membrane protein